MHTIASRVQLAVPLPSSPLTSILRTIPRATASQCLVQYVIYCPESAIAAWQASIAGCDRPPPKAARRMESRISGGRNLKKALRYVVSSCLSVIINILLKKLFAKRGVYARNECPVPSGVVEMCLRLRGLQRWLPTGFGSAHLCIFTYTLQRQLMTNRRQSTATQDTQ
jgi:hypothetical protein